MRSYGLKRWSMEDVAEHAAIGRTSVYRAFSTCDELVHAVLARELRTTIAHIVAAAARSGSAEDGIIEGALAGLAVLRGSLVEQLLRTDPSTVLPFLTTKAGPLIALARVSSWWPKHAPSVPPSVTSTLRSSQRSRRGSACRSS